MPDGKPAGVPCVQLTADNRCLLFGLPERPEVCVRLRPSAEMCGETTEHALAYLAERPSAGCGLVGHVLSQSPGRAGMVFLLLARQRGAPGRALR